MGGGGVGGVGAHTDCEITTDVADPTRSLDSNIVPLDSNIVALDSNLIVTSWHVSRPREVVIPPLSS